MNKVWLLIFLTGCGVELYNQKKLHEYNILTNEYIDQEGLVKRPTLDLKYTENLLKDHLPDGGDGIGSTAKLIEFPSISLGSPSNLTKDTIGESSDESSFDIEAFNAPLKKVKVYVPFIDDIKSIPNEFYLLEM